MPTVLNITMQTFKNFIFFKDNYVLGLQHIDVTKGPVVRAQLGPTFLSILQNKSILREYHLSFTSFLELIMHVLDKGFTILCSDMKNLTNHPVNRFNYDKLIKKKLSCSSHERRN